MANHWTDAANETRSHYASRDAHARSEREYRDIRTARLMAERTGARTLPAGR